MDLHHIGLPRPKDGILRFRMPVATNVLTKSQWQGSPPQDQRVTWSGFRFFLCQCRKRIGMYQKLLTFAAHKKGTLAQLVEQRTENPCVPGSIPGGTTTF